MELKVSSQGDVLNPKLNALIERQVDFALSRFEQRIREVSVRFSDLNGPKGGIDKHCKIGVTLRNGESIFAEVSDSEFEPAIHRVVDRVTRRIKRHLSLAHSKSRAAATHRKGETGIGE
ncbi:MAG: hypothetical protein DHS20C16_09600 [Phycisphaerae bacterium]|nr:MAG: hypothetical protein DHS20C16_09600 [Phycisphaerae bacterium]